VDHPLPHRILGRTGVNIPILGLGTAPAGHRPEEEAVPFYRRCLDAGVTLVDTGPAEGGFGRAQEYLGRLLPERRKEVFVATRVCEPDGERALAQLQRNLKTLGIEQADLVYVQSIGDHVMTPERMYARGGVCAAMDQARRDGLTRFLGVSGHCRPWRFVKAMQERSFEVMLTAVSIVARHIYGFEHEVWPMAAERGIGLLAMKVFGGVRRSEVSAKGANLPDDLKEAGLRYVLGLPHCSAAVIGMIDGAELERTLAWTRAYKPLSPMERAMLEQPTRALAAEWGELYGPADLIPAEAGFPDRERSGPL